MIRIETQQYPFEKRHPFDLKKVNLDEQRLLEQINVKEIIVKEFIDDNTFEHLLFSVLQTLLEDNKVYFVFKSGLPDLKSKRRSYKMMFYDYKKKLGKGTYVQSEFDTENDKSVFIGLVRVTIKNMSTVLEIPRSAWLFAFTVPKNKRSFVKNRKNFLQTIFDSTFLKKKGFSVNFLQIMVRNINKNSFLKIRTTGNNEEIITLFGFDKKQEKVINLVQQEIAVLSN